MLLIAFAALLTAAPEIVLETGHGANISALEFSPDGKFLVSASEDSTLKVWDPNTGAELRTLRGHTNIVTALAIDRGSTLIASASLDRTLRIWKAATGETVASFRGPAPAVYLLRITPDAGSLVTAETVAAGTILRLWDIKTGKQRRIIRREDAAVSQIFFSGPNMLVAEESGEDDSTGSLLTYNLQTGRQMQTRPALLCGASDDGKWIAIDHSTETARRALILDLAEDKPQATLSGQVSRVVFSANGEWLAYESASGDKAVVGPTAGGPARLIQGRGAEFSMIALSPDGRWLASAGADFSLHLWDTSTGKLAHATSGQYTPAVIAFSPDSRRVAVSGGGTDLGSAVELWDIARQAQLAPPRVKRAVIGLAFSKDGAYLAVSAPSLEVFNSRANESAAKFDCQAPALSPVFSPNGKWIAANCAGVVTVWSLAGAELFHFGETSNAAPGPILFSPDGRWLAAATSQGVSLYDTAARQITQNVKTSDPVSALAFNANGESLAFGLHLSAGKPDNSLAASLGVWDLRARRKLWSAPAGPWVSALQFTPQGHSLLVAAGSVIIFDSLTGKPVRTLAAKVPTGSSPTFSPNGEWFAAGWNSATHLWRLEK